MIFSDEQRRFMEDDIVDSDDRDRYLGNPPNGTQVAIVKTTSGGHYPTTANAFYVCTIINLLGDEVEGGGWTLSLPGATIFAANLGIAIPPSGTYVLAVRVPERWCFIYNG